jgi:hypothetical protein
VTSRILLSIPWTNQTPEIIKHQGDQSRGVKRASGPVHTLRLEVGSPASLTSQTNNMDPANHRDGQMLSNTTPQSQPSQAQEQTAYQQAPTHVPHTGQQSNMKLEDEVYAGMTFCPGIPDIPVARFLPPRGVVCNLMATHYHDAGPVSI